MQGTLVRCVLNPLNWPALWSSGSGRSEFKLSRAAAASSAVPVVLSPVTINNYGGSLRLSRTRLVEDVFGAK
jgi:hypothetical protein